MNTSSSASPTVQRGPGLVRSIGAGHLFALAFGAIIGVGWVVVLGEWLSQAGPVGAIVAFMAGGLVMMLIGLCYAELAAMIPVSGGEVAYTYDVFGSGAAFTVGWLLALTFIAVTAFEAISVGWLVGTLIPGVQGAPLYTVLGDEVRAGSLALGLGGTAVLGYLNYRGVKAAANLQTLLTYGLLGLTLLFVSGGILWGSAGNLEPYFTTGDEGGLWGGMLAVFMTAPFWFAGFNVIPQVMEERAAGTSLRAAGRMILLAIGIAGLFYCLVILSASMAAPWQRLLGEELPAAAAFEAALSPTLARLVLVAAVLGLITTWNVVYISATRVLFALGRGRLIPPMFGRVHERFGSPSVAVIFVGCIGAAGALLGRNAIIPIVNLAATCLAFAFLVSCAGVVRLRLTRPGVSRPYAVPGGIATAVVATVAALAMLALAVYQPYASADAGIPLEWKILGTWLLVGAAFWYGARRIRTRTDEAERRILILGGGESPHEEATGR